MPRGRMLNKKISQDEKVAKLSLKATLFYTWCIPNLDFEGRLLADAYSLKALFPFISEISPRNIPYLVKELVEADLVIYYGNDRHKYMQFKGFKNNQNLQEGREAPSEIPAPTQELLLHNSSVTHSKEKFNISKEKFNISKVVYDVIDDLNKVLGTTYKHTTKKTQELIQARLNEGFTVEDFKKVHRTMLMAWGADSKMCQFLRPITLYSNKFESYLNKKSPQTKLSQAGVEAYLVGKKWLQSQEVG